MSASNKVRFQGYLYANQAMWLATEAAKRGISTVECLRRQIDFLMAFGAAPNAGMFTAVEADLRDHFAENHGIVVLKTIEGRFVLRIGARVIKLGRKQALTFKEASEFLESLEIKAAHRHEGNELRC